MAPLLELSFWRRVGLEDRRRDVCLAAVREHYGAAAEYRFQGYCSVTYEVAPRDGRGRLLQLRPAQHALDVAIARAARQTYGPLAPRVDAVPLRLELPVPLYAFEMDLLPGVPLAACQARTRELDAPAWTRQVALVRALADFVARAWPSAPTEPALAVDALPGAVGARISPKLARLAASLPSAALRHRAARTLTRLPLLAAHPVVLNHGDLIPANLLVCPRRGTLCGVVDWTEAETLPFGTHLYALELLLGFVEHTAAPDTPASPASSVSAGSCASPVSATAHPRFTYFARAAELRALFWQAVWARAPAVQASMRPVAVARDLGVLLWYGFAWDEGAIDRVVADGVDADELACLRAFLGVDGP